MTRRCTILLLIASLIFGWHLSPAYAQPSPPDVLYYQNLAVVTPDLLAPPPSEGSLDWQKQISSVVGSQQQLPHYDLVAMGQEQNFTYTMMTQFLGADFTPENLPKTFALIQHVFADSALVIDKAKLFWHTRRPYLASKQVKLMINPVGNADHPNFSYPSGHTSVMRVLAEVIGLLLPDQRAMLRAKAEAIAWHRVKAGVHYPIDLEGGRNYALLMLGALLSDATFQAELHAAQSEMMEKMP